MKRNKKRVLIAVLAICALAAGGAAFTASNVTTPASPAMASASPARRTTAHVLSTDGRDHCGDLTFHAASRQHRPAGFDDTAGTCTAPSSVPPRIRLHRHERGRGPLGRVRKTAATNFAVAVSK